MSLFKKNIPIAITASIGLFLIFEYFLNIEVFHNVGSTIISWGMVISAFTFGLGFINLIVNHGTNVLKRTPRRWVNSGILLITFVVTLIVGFLPPMGANESISWLYQITVVPLGTAIYAMTGFYVASAAYRGFRVKNLPSFILLFVAAIVMLGNIPLGYLIWSGFPNLKAWIMSVPNGAAYRGILIGIFIGMLAIAVRIFRGQEIGYLGGEKE